MEFIETKEFAWSQSLDTGTPALHVEERPGESLASANRAATQTTLAYVGHSAFDGSCPPFASPHPPAGAGPTGEQTDQPFRTARRFSSCRPQVSLTGNSEAALDWDNQEVSNSKQLQMGEALYRRFNRFEPDRVEYFAYSRIMPPVVVELGELAGLIYRSDKWQSGKPRMYIHFMESSPRLVSNVTGTQLYIVGGKYRVTPRGIEG